MNNEAVPVSKEELARLRERVQLLEDVLRTLDARFHECAAIPATAADAYDSFYQGMVSEVLEGKQP